MAEIQVNVISGGRQDRKEWMKSLGELSRFGALSGCRQREAGQATGHPFTGKLTHCRENPLKIHEYRIPNRKSARYCRAK
jgi:hypothetical protein